jgi:hypothetical protein
VHFDAMVGYNVIMTIEVLDPTASGPLERLPLPEPLPTLSGRVLGLRIDDTWQSFTRFANRFAQLARERLQVRDIVVFDPDIRIGTTDEERRKVAGFVRDIDAAIVGLGT